MDRTIIDVREPSEFAEDHVIDALNIPLGQLQDNPKELQVLPKNSELVVYCRSGARSASAIEILKSLGYTNVVNGISQPNVEANYF